MTPFRQFIFLIGFLCLMSFIQEGSTLGITSTNDIFVEVYDWAIRIFVYNTINNETVNGNITTREKLPDFFITFNTTYIGEGSGKNPLKNYTIHNLPNQKQNITKYYNGIKSTVMQQSTTFETGVKFFFEVEFVEEDTWKDYNGWRLPIPHNGVKITVRFEDCLDSTVNHLNPDTKMWYGAMLDTTMLFPDAGFPVDVVKYVQLSEKVLPESNPDPPAHFTKLTWLEKRFNLTIDVLANYSACTDATETDCFFDKLPNFKFGVDADANIMEFVQSIAALIQDPEPVKFISIPVFIQMEGLGIYSALTWDPNFSLLFGDSAVQQPPPSAIPQSQPPTFFPISNPVGGPVDGPVAGVSQDYSAVAAGVTIPVIALLVVGLVVVWKVPTLRSKFLPMVQWRKSKKDIQLEGAQHDTVEKSHSSSPAQPASTTPTPSQNAAPTSRPSSASVWNKGNNRGTILVNVKNNEAGSV